MVHFLKDDVQTYVRELISKEFKRNTTEDKPPPDDHDLNESDPLDLKQGDNVA